MNKLTAFALAFATIAMAAAPGAVAIRNARIVTVSGPAVERGTVIIRDGLIEAAGGGATVPADAWVIDGQGLTVYPGLIDALSTIGIPDAAPPPQPTRTAGQRPATPPAPSAPAAPLSRGPEDRPATTSWQKAEDLVQVSDRRIETFRNGGFTTTVTFPAHGIFAGQGAVLDLAGQKPPQSV